MASELNKLLNLIDETLHFIDTSNEGKLIFITGRSAAGKTSLGEAFKTLDNFIHFDGDQFAYGFGDPILDSGKTFDGTKVKRNKEIQEAWGLASSKGFSALLKGEPSELSAWTPFYGLMLDAVKKAMKQYAGKHVVVTHSIYARNVRDWIRDTMNGNATFIILNTKIDLLGDRAVQRLEDMAKEMGMTPQEYLDSISDAIGHKLKAEQWKEVQAMMSAGLELMQEDEPNTFQVDVDENMDKTDVFEAAKKIIFQLM